MRLLRGAFSGSLGTLAALFARLSPGKKEGIGWRVSGLLLTWAVMLILVGIQYGVSRLHFAPGLRPVLLVLSVIMAALAAIVFMEIGKGPGINRLFAVASLLWLLILLGLGSMDPFTRVMYYVHPS
ncbi:MAG: hypothetical protein J2P49_00905 [Methylocapsa sp.]|nr:hypothetical protein [Methylocapsa sp.]